MQTKFVPSHPTHIKRLRFSQLANCVSSRGGELRENLIRRRQWPALGVDRLQQVAFLERANDDHSASAVASAALRGGGGGGDEHTRTGPIQVCVGSAAGGHGAMQIQADRRLARRCIPWPPCGGRRGTETPHTTGCSRWLPPSPLLLLATPLRALECSRTTGGRQWIVSATACASCLAAEQAAKSLSGLCSSQEKWPLVRSVAVALATRFVVCRLTDRRRA